MSVPRIVRVSAITVSLLAVGGRAAAQTPDVGPTMTLSIPAAASGQSVDVDGTGWPATTRVTIMVCGQDATGGTATCDVLGGQTVVTDATGSFRTPLTIRVPPMPCPCAVWASSPSSGIEATTPVAIVAAPYTPPAGPASPTPPSLGPVATDELAVPPVDDLLPWASGTWLFVVGLSAGALVIGTALIALGWRRRKSRQRQPTHRARSGPVTPTGGPDSPDVQIATAEDQLGGQGETSTESVPTSSMDDFGALPSEQAALVPVEFSLSDAGDARSVALCGDFNAWAPAATLLQHLAGRWSVTVSLEPGRAYHYRYLIDGERWVSDHADESALPNPFDPFEAEDCVITVPA